MAAVSIHLYFKVKDGKMEEMKATCRKLIPLIQAEEKAIHIGFSFHGDTAFCREAYEGAEGVMAHMANTEAGALTASIPDLADMERIEVHAHSEDIDALKEALQPMKPTYFTVDFGDGIGKGLA